jgi:hypothetical protein
MPSLRERLLQRVDRLIAKGERVLEARRDLRRSKKSEYITRLELDEEKGRFLEWQSQTVSFLVDVLGRDHIYTRQFASSATVNLDDNIEGGLGVLRAVKEDVEYGDLANIRTLVSAEVFSDFLQMAEHLHEAGYKDPAASLAGAVLEDGLRKIAMNKNIKLKTKEDINSLNRKIADSGVYNRLVQKKVQVWADIRNNADHGYFDEYTTEDVADKISGIEKFLADYLA